MATLIQQLFPNTAMYLGQRCEHVVIMLVIIITTHGSYQKQLGSKAGYDL